MIRTLLGVAALALAASLPAYQPAVAQERGGATADKEKDKNDKDKGTNKHADKQSNNQEKEKKESAQNENKSKDSAQSGNRSKDRDSSNDSSARDNKQSNRDSDRRGQQSNQYNDSRNNQSSDRDRSDRNTSGDRDSRPDIRGPDIGIWFSRNSRDGLVIADVSSKGAIARFGFHEGDRIVSVNGRRVTTEADFIQYVLHSDVDRVKIIVVRDGSEEVIFVEPQVLTREYEVEYTEIDPLERFGIIVDDRYDDRIVVWRVIPRSPAYYAGFRPGDVVVNFGGRPYKTRTEFERSAGDWKEGEVDVEVRRGDKTRQLSADVPKYERSNARTAERTDRQMDRQERRSERASSNQSGRRGAVFNRGR